MSRFNASRRNRIMAWTGAALAWATAATIAASEPANAGATAIPPTTPYTPSTVATASQVAAMPTMPPRGLVILRYRPSVDEVPEVRTVYVQQKAPTAASAAPANPVAAAAPAPQSSGS